MEPISVVVVAGPTASGKTRLAVELCRTLSGEVVSADSMQLYRGMPIATAQPTPAEMCGVPHHLIGFLPIGQPFSVADYVPMAAQVIRQVTAAGHLPVVTGGTGLYIRSLLQGLSFAPENADPTIRSGLECRLQQEGAAVLYAELQQADPAAAAGIHPNNIKRVLRVLEMYLATGRTQAQNAALSHRNPSPYRVCFLCLGFRDRAILYERINTRVQKMMQQGLEEEARTALRGGGATALQAIGCKELLPYFQGTCTREQAVESIQRETRRYAKRQMTWFRREPQAQWLWVDDYTDFTALAQDALGRVRVFLERSSS